MRTMIPRALVVGRGDDDAKPAAPTSTGETKAQRLDREHEQLFNEVRAVLPGVQIQGAFLLTVAFTERFQSLSDVQLAVYYVTFLLTAAALILLMAPAAFHRVEFRHRDKELMLRAANVEVIAALVLISFSIAGTVFLITDLVLSRAVSVIAGALAWLAASTLWWVFPLARRVQRHASPSGVPRLAPKP